MGVKIRVKGGRTSVRIEVSGCSRIEISSPRTRVTIGGVDFADRPARMASSRPEVRWRIGRSRALPDDGSISPEMEAAAVEAFLAGADAERLGRALAAVYRAKDAVRRG